MRYYYKDRDANGKIIYKCVDDLVTVKVVYTKKEAEAWYNG